MNNYEINLYGNSKPLIKHWEFSVGSCHASTALREDYRKMLTECHRDLGFRYIRFHGLFNDDMNVVQKSLFSDKYTFSFTYIDNIFDFILSIGMKPFVELGFMPQAFSSADTTIFHYRANTSPPKDYNAWSDFIKIFTQHIIQRYGLAEVRSWFFEVWNEPNLGGIGSPFGFWSGDMEEYFTLYKYTCNAVKSCDKRLRVGGPATSNNAWIEEFIAFCEKENVPPDFISAHHYPTDAILGYGVEDSVNFKNPLDINDAESIAKAIETAKAGGEAFDKLKQEYSVFKSSLWEHVDRGVLTEMETKARSQAKNYPLYYTEWGSLAGTESDSAFGASFIAKTVLDAVDIIDGCSFWTFSDIVEEDGQNSLEFHGGFGLMTQHGIPKAPYRVFQLLHMLGGDLYETVLRDGTVDIYTVKNRELHTLQILAVNHNSLLHPIKTEELVISIPSDRPCSFADIITVDNTHSNAYTVWKQQGEKEYLSKGDIDILSGYSQLIREEQAFDFTEKTISLSLSLEPMSVSLITLYF